MTALPDSDPLHGSTTIEEIYILPKELLPIGCFVSAPQFLQVKRREIQRPAALRSVVPKINLVDAALMVVTDTAERLQIILYPEQIGPNPVRDDVI